jgi:hypothetical protein
MAPELPLVRRSAMSAFRGMALQIFSMSTTSRRTRRRSGAVGNFDATFGLCNSSGWIRKGDF